jgi:xanthosine utilization system XapX-like protein
MKAFVLSVVAAIALGIMAAALLNVVQRPAYEAFATSGVRVSDPGYNLVGPDWSGEVSTPPTRS